MTSRISLRILSEADAAALYALVDISRDNLRQWLPWVDHRHGPADFLAFLQDAQADRQAGRAYVWLIEVNGQPAGICGLHEVSELNRHAAIGYWLADPFVGHGYLPQALRLLLVEAFDTLQLHRVEIVAASANLRSCAVAERSGFTQEGVLRGYLYLHDRFWDAKVYSLLAADWQAEKHTS